MKSSEVNNSIELSVLASLYNVNSQMRLTGTDNDRVESLIEDFKARQKAEVELLEQPLGIWLVVNESDDVTSVAIRDGNHRFKALTAMFDAGILKNANIPILVQRVVNVFNGFNAVENFGTNNALSWSEFDRANVAYRLSMGIDKNHVESSYVENFPKDVKLEVKDGKTTINGADLILPFEASKVLVFNEKEDSAVECTLAFKGSKTTVKWAAALSKFYTVHKALPTHIQIFGVTQDDSKKSMENIFKLVGFQASQAAYSQTYLGRLDVLYNFGSLNNPRINEPAPAGVWTVLDSADFGSKLNAQLTRFNFLNVLKEVTKKEKTIVQSITKILTPFIYNSFLNLTGLRLNVKETPVFGKPLEVAGTTYHNVFKLLYLAKYAKDNDIQTGTFAELEAQIKAAESARIAEIKAKETADAAEALKAAKEQDKARIEEISEILKGKLLPEILQDSALAALHSEKQHLISKNNDPNKDGQGNGKEDTLEDKPKEETKEETKEEAKSNITGAVDNEAFKRKAYENITAFTVKNHLNDAFTAFIMCVANDVAKLPITLSNNEAIKKFLEALKK